MLDDMASNHEATAAIRVTSLIFFPLISTLYFRDCSWGMSRAKRHEIAFPYFYPISSTVQPFLIGVLFRCGLWLSSFITNYGFHGINYSTSMLNTGGDRDQAHAVRLGFMSSGSPGL